MRSKLINEWPVIGVRAAGLLNGDVDIKVGLTGEQVDAIPQRREVAADEGVEIVE